MIQDFIVLLVAIGFTIARADEANSPAVAPIPAFPGAEGFGAFTPGGRSGQVIAVTNLLDHGPGSFRAACDTPGPRIIIFKTGGVIELKRFLRIREPFLTIAAQTAPGDGVCITGYPIAVETHDVIIRGLRIRTGDGPVGPKGSDRDSLCIGQKDVVARNIILDHCSFAWAVDENLSTWYPCENITIQWCVISEALYHSIHDKGGHSMGLLIGDHTHNMSIHHNLMVDNHFRNPQPKGDTTSEIINNVVYNFGWSAVGPDDPEKSGPSLMNIIGNIFIPGPDSNPDAGCVHVGHMMEGTKIFIKDNIAMKNWRMITPAWREQFNVDAPAFVGSSLKIEPTDGLLEKVLTQAGAIWPHPDAVDQRAVEHVRQNTGKIIDSQKQVGGLPQYAAGTAPTDTDNDGMPDAWETQHRLDPAIADDHDDADHDGYTNIEEYLNHTNPNAADR